MKKLNSQYVLVICLLITLVSKAQVSTIFNNVKFNESVLEVEKKLKKISNDVRLVKINTPSFPLSANKEEHLIASKVKLQNGTIDNVVFTFSDNKLSYIQVKGNVVKGLTTNIKK